MKILIIGLLFIVLISTASSHTSSQGSTIPYLLQAYVTKSGNITLSEDALGFTAPIDMSDHFSEASDGTTTFSMAISLYSSDTFFARNCMTLFSFYCAEDNLCTQHTESPFSASYVQLIAKGYYISTPAYLDYDHWTLNNQAGYATSCTSNIPLPYGNGRYGILGMGLGNGSQTNYLSSKVFSVNLNRTATRGGLVFHSQPVEFPSYTQVATLQTDENWNVIINSDSGAAITIGDNTYVFQANLILDMNSDLIGFPLTVYSYVIDFLEKNASMKCTDADYEPVCVYTGSTSNLPNMTLVVQQQKIQIPPYIYVQNFYTYSYQNGTFSLTLNIRKISSTLTGESYVSPYFENYVILDMNFLFNYIAVFNATSGFQITLYAPPYTNNNIPPQPGPAPTPSSNSHNNTAIHIIIGVVGFVMIVLAVFCVVRVCRRKRRQMNLDEESSYNLQNDEQTLQQRNIDPTMPPQVQQFYPQNYSQGHIQAQNQYYPVNQGQLSGNYINPQS